MIRFLQKDSRIIKGVFVAIIAVACITMVITLVPGIFQDTAATGNAYASIHSGGYIGRVFGPSHDITTAEVQHLAQRIVQRQHYPDYALPFVMPQAAQQLIQQEILKEQADHMGLKVTDDDLRYELRNGPFASALFPNGQYVGDDQYVNFVQNNFNLSKEDFEREFKDEIAINRVESLITGGVLVSDKEARDSYLQQGTKVKFEYAVLSADDLRKEINPSDTDLQTFFRQNAARYKDADPETRKIAYLAFTPDQVPGGQPQPSDNAVQQYYNAHQKEYQVADQVKVRHILIKEPAGADAKTDADVKAKAEDVLKQVRAGGNFADLAKKYSDDPGSKVQGGELGFIQHGVTVPAFDKAAFDLKPGETSDLVKTEYGYHIIQSEEKQTAHTKPLSEVKAQIVTALSGELMAQQEQNFASSLVNEAKSGGLEKTAAAHHLQVTTTDYLPKSGAVAGLPDGSKLLQQAFSAKQNAPPAMVGTGAGYAIFQVLDVKAAHAPSFDEYKSRLVEDFRDQQLPQLLGRKTNDLAAAAKAGDLDKAAKDAGATIKTSDLVGRNGQVPDIGALAQAAPQVFDMSVGQISGPINTGHSGLVVKLLDKQSPSVDDIAKNLEPTRQQMLNERREEAFSVFVSSLYDQYKKDGRIRMSKKAAAAMEPKLPG